MVKPIECENRMVGICKDLSCELCFKRSFAASDKAKFWDYEKNKETTPRSIPISTGKQYWFTCDKCSHSFCMKIDNIKKGVWCAFCASKRLCGELDCEFCNSRSIISHPAFKNWSNKNKENPRLLSKSSEKKAWFDCDKCHHSFLIAMHNITSGVGCVYCSANWKWCENQECQFCYERSFASSKMAIHWDQERNSKKPKDFTIKSGEKCYFKCRECNHSWAQKLDSINKCLFCDGKKLCNQINCNLCKSHSFASDEKSAFWNYKKNIVEPHTVFKMDSNIKYWFTCPDCKHDFDGLVMNISRGDWCPYCSYSNWKKCQKDNCDHCFNRSFASQPRAKNWDTEKNTVSILEVAIKSNIKRWFICDVTKRSFLLAPSAIANGNWCNCCFLKSENIVRNFLEEVLEKDVIHQAKFDWCKNENTGRFFPFDFAIYSKKKLVEVDGEQHFLQVSNWEPPEYNQQRDLDKMYKAILNGWSIIRISATDVRSKDTSWKEALILAIDNDEQFQMITTKANHREVWIRLKKDLHIRLRNASNQLS